MQLAIQTPPETTSFVELRDLWQAADDLGFWGAFTFDHLVALAPGQRPGMDVEVPKEPQLEGWTTLAALAAGTTRLRVGTLVSGVTYRPPSLLAKMVVTLDHITGGRAILGLGAGWHAMEHQMYGVKFPPVRERMGRLDEALRIFEQLCRDDIVEFHGRWYDLDGAVFEPKPVRPDGIPVLVGGSGPELMRIAARHAQIFNSFFPPHLWTEVNAQLDGLLEAEGRSVDELQRSAFVQCDLSGDARSEARLLDEVRRTRGGTREEVRRRIMIGDPDHMESVLRSYERAGVDLLVLGLRRPFSLDGLERFGREVLCRLV